MFLIDLLQSHCFAISIHQGNPTSVQLQYTDSSWPAISVQTRGQPNKQTDKQMSSCANADTLTNIKTLVSGKTESISYS